MSCLANRNAKIPVLKSWQPPTESILCYKVRLQTREEDKDENQKAFARLAAAATKEISRLI